MTEAMIEKAKESQALIPAEVTATPMDLLRIATISGADVGKLEKLMELQERWEATEARKAYVSAMNRFKADPPAITKNKLVSFDTAKGRTEYRHATLDHVCDEVTKALSAVGITHTWKIEQSNNAIKVICILTHELGHSEKTEMSGCPDASGMKNPVQQIASTVTYLERYTLLSACGLAAGEDDDSRGGGASGVAQDKVTEYCRQIADVTTIEDLRTVYARAYGEAQESNDRTAMARYIAAKDARKKEIANANR